MKHSIVWLFTDYRMRICIEQACGVGTVAIFLSLRLVLTSDYHCNGIDIQIANRINVQTQHRYRSTKAI